MEECTTNEACKEKDNIYEYISTILQGKYLKSLVAIPTGLSIQDWITKMKERKPEGTCFESAINHPVKIVEYQFKCPSIDGLPVVVRP